MRNKEEIENVENELRATIQELSDVDKKLFYSKIENKIKDPDTYAVLNWLFISGIHHFYLSKWLNGFINMFIFILGVALLFFENDILFGVGVGAILSLFIVELNQLFKSQLIVQDYNNQITKEILDKL